MNILNDKDNGLIEEMNQVLSGLEKLIKDREKRMDKKHWSEIKVPFTLNEELSKYTKNDLDSIRKNLQIKNASGLRKAELVTLLVEKIPANLENICLQLDKERFRLLTDIARNGGQITAPNLNHFETEHLRATGLIYSGIFEERKILAIPIELIEPILALKNNVNIRATINRNTEWIKLTYGLLYYYGTLSRSKLIEMVEKYTKDPIHFGEFFEIIQKANDYFQELYIDSEGVSNYMVDDPKRIKQEHLIRNSIPYYPFTKKQLLTAGRPSFVERNKSYKLLLNFLIQNYEIDKEEADYVVEECVVATKNGDSPNDILHYLSSIFEFDSMDTVQALMDKVVDLMNNTREWFLKGYTSTELFEHEKDQLKPISTPNSYDNNPKKTEKISRNSPCPCGSGKKYKKCCGK